MTRGWLLLGIFLGPFACGSPATHEPGEERGGGGGAVGGAVPQGGAVTGGGGGVAGSVAGAGNAAGGAPGGDGGIGADGGAGGATAGSPTGGSVSGTPGLGGAGADGGAGGATGGAGAGGTAGKGGGGAGGADPSFYVFLLIGQSNMEGMPQPEAQDRVENTRVKVLAYDNCSNLGRTVDQWYTASPPLHSCYAGVGPGDYFAKRLAAAFPTKTIGLVPCGIAGVDIDFFRKNVVSARRGEFRIPPDNHWAGAYEWVIERARLAQRSGVIRGMLFHQGESDNGNSQWLGKVQSMVNDLRADLGIGNVPFLAGELLYGGCCAGHNTLVNQLPSQITNAFAISASGLAGSDQAHFDLAGQRTFGTRYGDKMVEVGGL
jgi:hypothetical protein